MLFEGLRVRDCANLLQCIQVPPSVYYISKASKCRLTNLLTSYHAYKSHHQYVAFLWPHSADVPTCPPTTMHISTSSMCYISKASKYKPADLLMLYYIYKSLYKYVTFLSPQSADLPTCQPSMHTSSSINMLCV